MKRTKVKKLSGFDMATIHEIIETQERRKSRKKKNRKQSTDISRLIESDGLRVMSIEVSGDTYYGPIFNDGQVEFRSMDLESSVFIQREMFLDIMRRGEIKTIELWKAKGGGYGTRYVKDM
jgi:L-ribulose-5-phosphate 3-epimerase UlaE